MRYFVGKLFRPITLPVRFGLGGTTRAGQVARRIWLVFFLLIFVVTPLVWAYLAATFYLSRPANSFRLVDHFNADLGDIPEQERAWPLYQQALDEFRLTGVVEDRRTTGWTINRQQARVRLPASFMTVDDQQKQELIDFCQFHAEEIALLIEGTRRPSLGLTLPDQVEEYFDSSTRPYSTGSGAMPHVISELDAVGNLLRGEFLAAHIAGDTDGLLDVAKARVALVRQLAEGLPPFGSYFHYRMLGSLADDVTLSLTEKPGIWSDSQLSELRQLCSRLQQPAASGQHVTTLLTQNFLDQVYSEYGYFTPAGLEKVRAVACVSSFPVDIALQDRHYQWLGPEFGISTGRWRRQLTAALIVPVAVRDFPSRRELLAQLEARSAARRKAMEAPVCNRPTDFNKRIEIKIENWRDIPGTTLARASFLPLSLDPVPTRFAAIGLLCELAAVHNEEASGPIHSIPSTRPMCLEIHSRMLIRFSTNSVAIAGSTCPTSGQSEPTRSARTVTD